ncbi:hypothetical protein BTVI_74537 [Pitangus sulphuratus]|nr:hypothetical protein BTVI_74537 [Pitangus sulphuratus]
MAAAATAASPGSPAAGPLPPAEPCPRKAPQPPPQPPPPARSDPRRRQAALSFLTSISLDGRPPPPGNDGPAARPRQAPLLPPPPRLGSPPAAPAEPPEEEEDEEEEEDAFAAVQVPPAAFLGAAAAGSRGRLNSFTAGVLPAPFGRTSPQGIAGGSGELGQPGSAAAFELQRSRRSTCWRIGMDFNFVANKGSDIITVAFYGDNSQHWGSLLLTVAASREVDYIPSQVVCPLKDASSTALPVYFRGRPAEFEASWVRDAGGGDSRASLLQGVGMPLAVREDCFVTWRSVWFHPVPPPHVEVEKEEPGDEYHIRLCLQACLDHIHTFVCTQMQSIPTVQEAVILCSHWHVL